MAGGTGIRNEIGLRRVLAGTEAIPGVAVTPDYRWYGNFVADKSAALVRTPEMTGTYDGLVTPRREIPTYSGNYGESLSFQSFTQHCQYAIAAGATGVADDDGFIYSFVPNGTADDIATATVEYGVEGQVWRSTGVSHNEFTVTIDTDDADGVWKMSSNLFVRDKVQVVGHTGTATGGTTSTVVETGAGWSVNQWADEWVFLDFGTGSGEVRQVESNTTDTLTLYGPILSEVPTGKVFRIEGAFTSGVAFSTYDTIPVPGTQLFIDPFGDALGTNEIVDRMISYNITVNNARTGKRFANNHEELAAKTGRGFRLITGQVRLEFDRRDEYEQYEQLDEVGIRVVQEGPALGETPGDNMYAQIDVNRAVWDVVDMNERENNITATFGFVAYLNPGDDIAEFSGKHDLATLP